eukprot:scaffold16135_cov169-Ochromonas_danica.AAC.1
MWKALLPIAAYKSERSKFSVKSHIYHRQYSPLLARFWLLFLSMRDAIAPPLCISQKPCETIANQMSFFFHHHHHQNQQPKKDIHELVPEVRQLLNEDVNADLSDDDVKRFLTARALDVTKAVKMIEKWHN